MTFTEPHGEIVLNEIADLLHAVIGPRPPPRCTAKIVLLIEIDPAFVVRIGPVKSPGIQIASTIVIGDHTDKHRHPELMGGLYEALECIRPAVGAFDTENVGGIVAPTVVPGKLGRGHDFHDTDAKL